MNWVRYLWIMIIAGPKNQQVWLFMVGPLLGCLLAVLAIRALAGTTKTSELAAAAGEAA